MNSALSIIIVEKDRDRALLSVLSVNGTMIGCLWSWPNGCEHRAMPLISLVLWPQVGRCWPPLTVRCALACRFRFRCMPN